MTQAEIVACAGMNSDLEADPVHGMECSQQQLFPVVAVWSRCGPAAQKSAQTRMTTQTLYLFV
jgi:hypothetical protein